MSRRNFVFLRRIGRITHKLTTCECFISYRTLSPFIRRTLRHSLVESLTRRRIRRVRDIWHRRKRNERKSNESGGNRADCSIKLSVCVCVCHIIKVFMMYAHVEVHGYNREWDESEWKMEKRTERRLDDAVHRRVGWGGETGEHDENRNHKVMALG